MHRALVSLAALALALAPSLASAQVVLDAPLPEPTTEIAPHEVATIAAPTPPPPTRAVLRATLASRRAAHLAELRRYVDAGVFPVNDVQPGYLNVFRDPSGHLCAVANLMSFDGGGAMVDRTALATNYVRLVEVHEGELYDWILASGFTQEEIGRIQEPYFFQEAQIDRQQQQRQLDRERHRLQRALNRTIARLQRDTERSLDRAVDRLMESQGLAEVSSRRAAHARG
jgi:hypothetical protein